MPNYPTITCVQEYLDYYGRGSWAGVPPEQVLEVSKGIERCRVAQLDLYCSQGYSDACIEIGRAIELQAKTPEPSFGRILWDTTKERLGSIEAISATLHEGAQDVSELLGGLTDAALSVPGGIMKGLPDVPDLTEPLGVVKIVAVAAIVVGAAYLLPRKRS